MLGSHDSARGCNGVCCIGCPFGVGSFGSGAREPSTEMIRWALEAVARIRPDPLWGPFKRIWPHTFGTYRPVAGIDDPRSFGVFRARLQSDADCLDYLGWLRWPSAFVCP